MGTKGLSAGYLQARKWLFLSQNIPTRYEQDETFGDIFLQGEMVGRKKRSSEGPVCFECDLCLLLVFKLIEVGPIYILRNTPLIGLWCISCHSSSPIGESMMIN